MKITVKLLSGIVVLLSLLNCKVFAQEETPPEQLDSLYIKSYSNGCWTNPFRQQANQYSENGLIISKDENDTRTEYVYDANDYNTEQISFSKSGADTTKTAFEYDLNGNIISNIPYTLNNAVWDTSIYESIYKYTYDVNNNLTSQIRIRYSGGNWSNYIKMEYTWQDNYKTNSKYYRWNGSEWDLMSESDYYYENNLLLADTSYYLGEYSGYHSYTYNTNNDITSKTIYNYSGSDWVPSVKELFTYDLNFNLTEEASYDWDDPDWLKTDEIQYSYIDNSLIEKIEKSLSEVDSSIVAESKVEYIWDRNQLPIIETYYSWALYYWAPDYRSEYFYNGQTPVTLADECPNTTREFTLSSDCVTRLSDTELDMYIKIFPNPARDKITISISDHSNNGDYLIQLFTTSGQEIYSQHYYPEVYPDGFEVSINNYPKGIYLLTISNETEVSNTKIIIQ